MSRLDTLDSLRGSRPSWGFSTYMANCYKMYILKSDYHIIWSAAYKYHQGRKICLGSPA
ncbi:hypothetical protein VPHD292_0102 [Vibrio phage D292]